MDAAGLDTGALVLRARLREPFWARLREPFWARLREPFWAGRDRLVS